MKTIPAAPTVRRFAREIGVDLTTVSGSGPGGRISIDDVKVRGQPPALWRRRSRRAGDDPRAAGPRAIRTRPPRADDQGPQADRRESLPCLDHGTSGHQPRDRRHHRSRAVSQGLQGACRGRRRQAHDDRAVGQDRRHRPQGPPGAQRRGRHGAAGDRLPLLDQHRGRGGHRARPAGAGRSATPTPRT